MFFIIVENNQNGKFYTEKLYKKKLMSSFEN
eukprot:UN11018